MIIAITGITGASGVRLCEAQIVINPGPFGPVLCCCQSSYGMCCATQATCAGYVAGCLCV